MRATGFTAPNNLPKPLAEQLKIGGRMVIPVGPVHGTQHLRVYEKNDQGELTGGNVMEVRFVPLTGKH